MFRNKILKLQSRGCFWLWSTESLENVRSEKLQNESSPKFSNSRPELFPEFCSEISPIFLRSFRASSRHFSVQNSQANSKRKSTQVFWRAGKVWKMPPKIPVQNRAHKWEICFLLWIVSGLLVSCRTCLRISNVPLTHTHTHTHAHTHPSEAKQYIFRIHFPSELWKRKRNKEDLGKQITLNWLWCRTLFRNS